jgi:hypothetical protein
VTAKDVYRVIFTESCFSSNASVVFVLSKLMDLVSKDMINCSELLKLADLLKYRRLRWLGHIQHCLPRRKNLGGRAAARHAEVSASSDRCG